MAKKHKIKFEVGDKVKLIDSYDGCFKDFKDKILTIDRIFEQDESTDDVGIQIAEISEVEFYHFIYQSYFEPA